MALGNGGTSSFPSALHSIPTALARAFNAMVFWTLGIRHSPADRVAVTFTHFLVRTFGFWVAWNQIFRRVIRLLVRDLAGQTGGMAVAIGAPLRSADWKLIQLFSMPQAAVAMKQHRNVCVIQVSSIESYGFLAGVKMLSAPFYAAMVALGGQMRSGCQQFDCKCVCLRLLFSVPENDLYGSLLPSQSLLATLEPTVLLIIFGVGTTRGLVGKREMGDVLSRPATV